MQCGEAAVRQQCGSSMPQAQVHAVHACDAWMLARGTKQVTAWRMHLQLPWPFSHQALASQLAAGSPAGSPPKVCIEVAIITPATRPWPWPSRGCAGSTAAAAVVVYAGHCCTGAVEHCSIARRLQHAGRGWRMCGGDAPRGAAPRQHSPVRHLPRRRCWWAAAACASAAACECMRPAPCVGDLQVRESNWRHGRASAARATRNRKRGVTRRQRGASSCRCLLVVHRTRERSPVG